MKRSGGFSKKELLKDCHQALDNGDILILFPEGSRGEPEVMRKLKKGLFYIIKDRTDTLTVPVMMHGLGKALPKGEALLVPFNCDVIIGKPPEVTSTSLEFNTALAASFAALFSHYLTQDKSSSMQ